LKHRVDDVASLSSHPFITLSNFQDCYGTLILKNIVMKDVEQCV